MRQRVRRGHGSVVLPPADLRGLAARAVRLARWPPAGPGWQALDYPAGAFRQTLRFRRGITVTVTVQLGSATISMDRGMRSLTVHDMYFDPHGAYTNGDSHVPDWQMGFGAASNHAIGAEFNDALDDARIAAGVY